jgi:hypothetical protein
MAKGEAKAARQEARQMVQAAKNELSPRAQDVFGPAVQQAKAQGLLGRIDSMNNRMNKVQGKLDAGTAGPQAEARMARMTQKAPVLAQKAVDRGLMAPVPGVAPTMPGMPGFGASPSGGIGGVLQALANSPQAAPAQRYVPPGFNPQHVVDPEMLKLLQAMV